MIVEMVRDPGGRMKSQFKSGNRETYYVARQDILRDHLDFGFSNRTGRTICIDPGNGDGTFASPQERLCHLRGRGLRFHIRTNKHQ